MSLFADTDGKMVDERTVERALGWMEKNIAALSQAIANRQHIEQYVKAVEAREKAAHKDQPAHVQEREARASQAYADVLEAFREASAEEQRLRYLWTLAQSCIDVYRTQAANTRRIG